MSRIPRPCAFAVLSLALAFLVAAPAEAAPTTSEAADERARAAIEAFKRSPRGPFEGIRWFCGDGSIHPAQPYPCRDRGDGKQHGLLGAQAKSLREAGYPIAQVLADLDPSRFVGPDPHLEELRGLLLERFLITWDDGWIFKNTRTYRGALQAEDEEAGARGLVAALCADPAWRAPRRFFLLRESARLLPHSSGANAASVRAHATRISELDASFEPLRVRIHNAPSAADAERLRAYSDRLRDGPLRVEVRELARAIDELFAPRETGAIARELRDLMPAALRSQANLALEALNSEAQTLKGAARLLELIRAAIETAENPTSLPELLQASVALETQFFAGAQQALTNASSWTRRERLERIEVTTRALYGVGLIGERQLAATAASIERLRATPQLSVYRAELAYLSRLPGWSSRTIAFHFDRATQLLARIEPQVHLYGPDRLRGSPALFVSALLDGLTHDAQQLAGVQQSILGRQVGSGVRALNPGLARGRLRIPEPAEVSQLETDAIAVLPETTAELPPVAGIVTAGEGNALSHVQLLARNLGVPNVVVSGESLTALQRYAGERVVLAVSPRGVVRLERDSPQFDALFAASGPPPTLQIDVDLTKLDLKQREPVPLAKLRASASGRICGPKGANLGELMHHFGSRVPDGFVIPFGAFRAHLEQPYEPGGPAMFEWMRAAYRRLAAIDDPGQRREPTRTTLAQIRAWILATPLAPDLAESVREALRTASARRPSGFFVRSDTNVEDLPGFTGAGLNLTLPNRVGSDAVLEGIREVWASPFTERSFAWRQAHMTAPEWVLPAVVVQRAFPAEKSGVMVTVDVEIGSPDFLSVAVNEGVGGAVDGQAAESLRISVVDGSVRLLALATAPVARVLAAEGGISEQPASGSQEVLSTKEIRALVRLARSLQTFPGLGEPESRPRLRWLPRLRSRPSEPPKVQPADVEFAFADGELALLQIRPFVENRNARRLEYLLVMDQSLSERAGLSVNLDQAPRGQP